MKKKIVIMATMIVAILSIVLLSGCTPSTPNEFLAKLVDTDECTIVVGEGENGFTYTFDGNKVAFKSGKEETYIVYDKDYVKKYTKLDKGQWTYEKIEDKSIIETLNPKSQKENLIKKGGLYTENISEQFDANYVKKDKAWFDKATGKNKVEISKGSLVVYSGKDRAYTYILKGYVIIPSDAMQAENNKNDSNK